MAENLKHDVYQEDVEEYVLLDLDAVSGLADIPPNAPYVVSGLDTLNPLLVIDDKVKLERFTALQNLKQWFMKRGDIRSKPLQWKMYNRTKSNSKKASKTNSSASQDSKVQIVTQG